MVSTPYHCMTLSLLILPPLVLAAYFLTSFPHPPEAPAVHFSLASLPPSSPSWDIYPDTFYDGGAYVHFPHGRVERFSSSCLGVLIFSLLPKVRYWLLGPEDGKKVTLATRVAFSLRANAAGSGDPHPWTLYSRNHLERRRPGIGRQRFSCPTLRYSFNRIRIETDKPLMRRRAQICTAGVTRMHLRRFTTHHFT